MKFKILFEITSAKPKKRISEVQFDVFTRHPVLIQIDLCTIFHTRSIVYWI